MKKRVCVAALLATAGSAFAQSSTVVPNAYETDPGTIIFLGPLANSVRTYQLIISESQLGSIIGQDITGIAWRLPASATVGWPDLQIEYFTYDILMSEAVNPADRLFDFGANIVGSQSVVRSGPLTITPFSYPSGGAPNDFGAEIEFDTPWNYAGGNLAVQIVHNGSTGTSRAVDAIGTGIPGYLTDFAAVWQGTSNVLQGNFAVVRLITEGGAPTCPPDLNGDGVVDADDFFLFLQLFADGDPRADFNSDGVIDADDFFAFLNAFALGC
ncbi:MAG: dockerin type I repeat-containing protein [Phycisphaerales bacterium]|nr:dockerin type I repeat-containing protein [Phycisphaerales bacterium]